MPAVCDLLLPRTPSVVGWRRGEAGREGGAGMVDDGGEQGEAYGAAYFASHCGPFPYAREVPHWTRFFGGVADEIVARLRPKRVFDAGCAHGFLVEALWDRG